MIDDHGAESIGTYGGESYATPEIDRLVTQGMKFNNAFSQPMCQISRATLMSGQYGFRNGFPKSNDRPLSSADGWGTGQPSVANLLQDAGDITANSGHCLISSRSISSGSSSSSAGLA
jgi:arylsulfatase A-like enzyme